MAASIYEFEWQSENGYGTIFQESKIKVCATDYDSALNAAIVKANTTLSQYNQNLYLEDVLHLHKIGIAL